MNISVEIEGKKQFRSDMDRFINAADKPFAELELTKKIQKAFLNYMKAAFRTEGSSTGAKWQELSDTPPRWSKAGRSGGSVGVGMGYRSWKQSKVPSAKILVGIKRTGKGKYAKSGRLKKSLTQVGGEHWYAVGGKFYGQQFELGSEVPYAGYHDSKEPRKSNLPRRPILRLNDKFIKRIHNMIHKYVFAKFKKGRASKFTRPTKASMGRDLGGFDITKYWNLPSSGGVR